jgi:S-disulfanyl-L-cysteine oxidoreductase SoxD
MKKIAASIVSLSFIALGASVWDGVYTEEQSKRGESIYQKECASCHGENLAGKDQAPPLTGNDFKMDWNGLSVGDLFDRIRVSMPADHPGKLSPDQNADVLAFILKANQFPAGKKDLPADSDALKQIQFETTKP